MSQSIRDTQSAKTIVERPLSLNTADEAKMVRLAATLKRVAPKPGSLVYLDSAMLPFPIGDMETAVFSAFDACTHLQVARVYLTNSFASAADFLEFLHKKFPFGISRIRTTAKDPFWSEPGNSTLQRFTNHLEAQGIIHTVIDDGSRDDFYSLFDHLTFVHQAGNCQRRPKISEIIGELIAFLHFHNNSRTMASLSGKTPIEKMRTFPGLEEIQSFDPFAIESN
jgi:hypothetical protein